MEKIQVFSLLVISLMLCNGIYGGWEPMKNPNGPHVVEIGEFTVTQHNKKAKKNLKFESVIKGETQVIAGLNYKLVIVAKDGVADKAVVWEKAWLGYRNLTSFKIIRS
ncbi:LOW QUALITY PROTEIN: Cystatin domain [Dillenia turbinata]|uniref:Cystatin domain n=1 Tax=Dillenia turbinata TaxID=194707 RepID=A0AAN8VX95_9MAGN